MKTRKSKLLALKQKKQQIKAVTKAKEDQKKLKYLKNVCDKMNISYGHSVGIKTLEKRIKDKKTELKKSNKK